MSAIDTSGFREFAAVVDRAETNMAAEIRSVVVKGAVNVKATMRADMRQRPHFRKIAQDIDFDVLEERDAVSAAIGPVIGRGKGHAGGLAWIAYFGAPNGGGGTVRDPQAALDEEEQGLLSALADVAGGLL